MCEKRFVETMLLLLRHGRRQRNRDLASLSRFVPPRTPLSIVHTQDGKSDASFGINYVSICALPSRRDTMKSHHYVRNLRCVVDIPPRMLLNAREKLWSANCEWIPNGFCLRWNNSNGVSQFFSNNLSRQFIVVCNIRDNNSRVCSQNKLVETRQWKVNFIWQNVSYTIINWTRLFLFAKKLEKLSLKKKKKNWQLNDNIACQIKLIIVVHKFYAFSRYAANKRNSVSRSLPKYKNIKPVDYENELPVHHMYLTERLYFSGWKKRAISFFFRMKNTYTVIYCI